MKLAATHTDGRKLYAPEWDSDGEIVASTKPVAAVSIDRDGVTFPEGSIWIRNTEGWNWSRDYREAAPDCTGRPTAFKSTDRLVKIKIAAKNITRHGCECDLCGKVFYAQRRDAKYCSLRHRVKASRQRVNEESLAVYCIRSLGVPSAPPPADLRTRHRAR